MVWTDIVLLVLSATLANHLGLVEAVEGVIQHRLPIVDCPKCCSFWCVLCYTLFSGCGLIASVAMSFMSAYAAVWLVLLYGYVDTLYNKLYEDIYTKDAGDDAGAES